MIVIKFNGVIKMIYEREWSNPNYEFSTYTVENLNWHLHFHEVFEICYVISGRIKITIDKEDYNLKNGDGVIIFPRQLHRYESAHDSKMHMITFMPKLIPEFVNRYKNMIPKNNVLIDIKKYKDEFNPENIFEQKSLLYGILGMLTKNTDFKESMPRGESRMLLKILKFIECNYFGDCSLDTVSKQLSYGYTYLSRNFKKLMNMSYMEYLNRYRINRAIYILSSEKNVPIQEVAVRCGYDSLCSFNRNFKAITGMTPSKMQNQDRK